MYCPTVSHTSLQDYSEIFFMLDCTVRYGEWQSTALFGSAPVCEVNSGMGVTEHC